MKKAILVVGLAVPALIFQGCAGYNTTMFMTKSNVGLDFDAKPPTIEINVARKEAVIEPSFEGGKAPPVLASFHPSAGSSGLTSFFMGVDQTFAGGDAAYAMSKLYDNPTATDKSAFNSALRLSKKPVYTDWFRSIPGSGKTRPLIFATDTSLGLKVAWSGAGGQIPDTVKLGFNRKEFAWSPISATPTDPALPDGAVDVVMPAFLATIESKQSVSSSTTDTNKVQIESMQYFATGDAATYMAMQKNVRAAMISRLDPNQQVFSSRFSAEGLDVFSDILFSDQTILTHWSDHGDKMAAAYLDALDKLSDLGIPDKYRNDTVPEYTFDLKNLLLHKNQGGELSTTKDFAGIIGYLSSLEDSKESLTNALGQIQQGASIKLQVGNGVQPVVTPPMVLSLATDLANLQHGADKLKQALAANANVKAADYYVQHKSSVK